MASSCHALRSEPSGYGGRAVDAIFAEYRCPELRHRQGGAEHPREHLAQPEKLEVVDQEGGQQQHAVQNTRPISTAPAIDSIRQITGSAIGRHCHISDASARLAASTKLLRSIGTGTMRVHQRLNAGRAITLCCRPNRPISSRLTITASARGPEGPLSISSATADRRRSRP